MSMRLSVLTTCVCISVCVCECECECVSECVCGHLSVYVWVRVSVCTCKRVLTTAEFISLVSTVVDAVTLPELGLAQAVLTFQVARCVAHCRQGGERLSRQSTFNEVLYLTVLSCYHLLSRLASPWIQASVLTAVELIGHVSTVVPAVTFEVEVDAHLVLTLQLLGTS